MDLIKVAEEAFATGKQHPSFKAGDTITVAYSVERIFPLESPNIESIEVNKVGKVRRAKLYYLRKLTGKAARIKEKRSGFAGKE